MGATTLLIDEDTCATNFMIRDSKMQQLVATHKEPITPFVSIVRSLYKEREVSTVLVVGGAGDYFDVADHVLLMDSYSCEDATQRALEIARTSSTRIPRAHFGETRPRFPLTDFFSPNGRVKSLSRSSVSYGDIEIDLNALEQIVSISQTNAITAALQTLSSSRPDGNCTLRELLESLGSSIDERGIDVLAPGQFNGQLALPRLLELSGAVNRLRRPCIRQGY